MSDKLFIDIAKSLSSYIYQLILTRRNYYSDTINKEQTLKENFTIKINLPRQAGSETNMLKLISNINEMNKMFEYKVPIVVISRNKSMAFSMEKKIKIAINDSLNNLHLTPIATNHFENVISSKFKLEDFFNNDIMAHLLIIDNSSQYSYYDILKLQDKVLDLYKDFVPPVMLYI